MPSVVPMYHAPRVLSRGGSFKFASVEVAFVDDDISPTRKEGQNWTKSEAIRAWGVTQELPPDTQAQAPAYDQRGAASTSGTPLRVCTVHRPMIGFDISDALETHDCFDVWLASHECRTDSGKARRSGSLRVNKDCRARRCGARSSPMHDSSPERLNQPRCSVFCQDSNS